MSKIFNYHKTFLALIFAFTFLAFSFHFDSRDRDVIDAQNQSEGNYVNSTSSEISPSFTIVNSERDLTHRTNQIQTFTDADTFLLNANAGPANNGGSPGWGMFLNLTAGANEVTVVQLRTASAAPAFGTFSVEVFRRTGTALGGPVGSGPGSSSAGWTSLGIATATQGPTASGISEYFNIPPIVVEAGQTVGVALVFTGFGPRYFGTGSPPLGTYSDANLTLVTGDVRSVPFTPTGSFFTSRELTGGIRYTTSSPPPPPPGAFPESFESPTFPPPGWGKLNPDGGAGWNRQTVGTSPIPGWTGGVITSPPGGENAVAFCTWNTGGATSNDQWLYTPQISGITAADSLTFWMKRTYDSFADQVQVRLSTSTPTVANFSNLLLTKMYAANNGDTLWTRYAISLAPYAGQSVYIAWRELVADNFVDGAAISLDLVNITGTITNISNEEIPTSFSLSQNYPNPFNPVTKIKYSVAAETLVTLKVFDISGREIATLVNSPKMPGSYEVNFNAANLSSGMYFYKIQAGEFVETKRMVLVK